MKMHASHKIRWKTQNSHKNMQKYKITTSTDLRARTCCPRLRGTIASSVGAAPRTYRHQGFYFLSSDHDLAVYQAEHNHGTFS